jgi:hypothetical protein
MNQVVISVDKILRLHFVPCQQVRILRWEEAEPAIKFFGFTLIKENPEGWRDISLPPSFESRSTRFNEEEILSNPRYFKRHDVPQENSIWEKSTVIIESIGGKYTNSDYYRFESDKEALDFMNEIAEKFPHVKVEYKQS